MIAARLANMKDGGDRRSDQRPDLDVVSNAEAGQMVGVGHSSADRAKAVLDILDARGSDIASLRLFEPRESLAPLWRGIVNTFEQRGTEVLTEPLAAAAASGDLAASLIPGFTPQADGTLQLLRSHGPREAAEEVAAWLAALPDPRDVVLIGSDPILDEALHRHGLPTTGATPASGSTLLPGHSGT